MTKRNEAGLATVSHAAPYGIEHHSHRYAAWAASLSVKGCRFRVEQGRAILEACGFDADFSRPEQLPTAVNMDDEHRWWRASVIKAAKSQDLTFKDGVAAKLINVYLKSRFVCGGHHAHERVHNLHPPVDAVLLKSLADNDFGGNAKQWRRARRKRWSKLSSDEYEQVITLIRECLAGEPLWKIEEYWKGSQ